MNGFILLLLEKVCEAIYFALFIIYGKNLKEKRLLFIGIMIFEYLIFKSVIHYNVWFQILYTFMSFINLKVLYKEKAQVTDVFLFMVASVILMILGALIYLPVYFICNENVTLIPYIMSLIINRTLMFSIIFLLHKNINKFYKNFYKHWNRPNKKHNNKIKSLTLRNISVIIFNLMFCIINLTMAFCLLISH